VDLPESIAEQKPRQNVVVMVTEHDILVQGSRIALVKDVNSSNKLEIDSLKAALVTQNRRRLLASNSAKTTAPEVTIMGNKDIPYQLLKKVMATCTEAGFGKISLAVMQKAAQES
jgi:biopolymer transport protein ExbD